MAVVAMLTVVLRIASTPAPATVGREGEPRLVGRVVRVVDPSAIGPHFPNPWLYRRNDVPHLWDMTQHVGVEGG